MSTKSGWKFYLIATTPFVAIFLLIPFELYFNGREYWNWNYAIPASFAAAGIFSYFLLAIIMWVFFRINSKVVVYTTIFLFFLGIFVLLADLFSPLQTTPLDGTELLSDEPLKYSFIEMAIFAGILISAIKMGRLATSIATPVSIILVVISAVYFGFIVTSSKPIATVARSQNFDPNIRGNVYHIVLDEMQTDIAVLFLEEKNGYKHFKGFTLFEKNISNYLYTLASLPSYMTGSLYKFGNFENWTVSYKKRGLIKKLYDSGYNISFYSALRSHCTPEVSECISIDEIYEQVTNIKKAQYKDFIQIWFSRLLPNIFTNRALAMGKTLSVWILRMTELEKKEIPYSIREGKKPFSSVLMFKKLIKSEKNRPPDGQYIYAHAILPHGPYAINANGKYEPGLHQRGTNGYYEQVQCAFNLVINFLDELKRLGRYDNATIIIHGDTGHGHRGFIKKVGSKLIGTVDKYNAKKQRSFFDDQGGKTVDWLSSRTMALLMIKPASLNEGFIKSDQKSQLIDLLPTILDLIDIDYSDCEIDGFSLFEEGFPENRTANFYYWWPPNNKKPNVVRINILNQDKHSVSQIINEGYIEIGRNPSDCTKSN